MAFLFVFNTADVTLW